MGTKLNLVKLKSQIWLYMKLLKSMLIYSKSDVIDSNNMIKCNWNLIILSNLREELL